MHGLGTRWAAGASPCVAGGVRDANEARPAAGASRHPGHGDTAGSPAVLTQGRTGGMRERRCRPLPRVFARVLGGRPGQLQGGTKTSQQNCTSLFHSFCRTVKEHPAEYVTHTFDFFYSLCFDICWMCFYKMKIYWNLEFYGFRFN